jgi:hypothetical protein
MKKKEEVSIRNSFSMWHRNGEIWVENLDGIYEFEEIVLETYRSHLTVLQSGNSPNCIAINLKNTLITDKIAETIVTGLNQAGDRIHKVAFIGVAKELQPLMIYYLRKYRVFFACRFFHQFKTTKNWLM